MLIPVSQRLLTALKQCVGRLVEPGACPTADWRGAWLGAKDFQRSSRLKEAEAQTLRRATFYLLKNYKALLDYDRGTTYFRRNRPPVAEFEPWRATLQARFLGESEGNLQSTSTAIDLLASLDPPLAIRLHNTLRNMTFAFQRNLSEVSKQDVQAYAGLLQTQDRLVATTLDELRIAALHVARRSGFGQHRKVERWIAERLKGDGDFSQRMDEQAATRNRAWSLAHEADLRHSYRPQC
jgi:hypothetical protein